MDYFYVILDKKKIVSGLSKPTKLPTSTRTVIINDKKDSVSISNVTSSTTNNTEDINLSFGEKKEFWESIESPKDGPTDPLPTSVPTKTSTSEKRSSIPVPKSRFVQPTTSTTTVKNEISSLDSEIMTQKTESVLNEDKIENYEDEIFDRAQFFIGNKSENIITKSSTERRTDFAFDNEGFQSTNDSVNLDDQSIKIEQRTEEIEEDSQISIDKSEIETSEKIREQDVDKYSNLTKQHLVERSFDSYEETKSTTTDHSFEQDLTGKPYQTVVEDKPDQIVNFSVSHGPIDSEKNAPNCSTNEDLKSIKTDIENVTTVKTQPDTLLLSSSVFDELVVEQTLNEVKESIDAIQEGLIEVVKDGKLIKESPSEFEFKPLSQVKFSEPIMESYFEDTSSHGDVSLGERIVEKVATQDAKGEAPTNIEPEQEKPVVSFTDILSPADSSSPVLSNIDEVISKPDQKLRPSTKHPQTQRWSMNETENISNSDHSHQSFERSDSRPLSSDMTSEYQTADDQVSFRIGSTTDYMTAVSSTFDSTMSSHESMKSFTSGSSGQLGSIEVSEATETLIPSVMDAENEESSDFEEGEPDTKCGSFEEKGEAVLLEYDGSDSTNLMKRSHEMTFQEDQQIIDVADIPAVSAHLISMEGSKYSIEHSSDEMKIASSLEEGSVLSVSMSSTSYGGDTIVENIPDAIDMASLSGSLVGSFEAPPQMHEEMTKQSFGRDADQFSQILNEPTTPTMELSFVPDTGANNNTTSETNQEFGKRPKGHKRNESTSFANFTGFDMSNQSSEDFEDLNEEMIVHEDVPAIPFEAKLCTEEKRDSESDSDYDRYETEYSRAFKLPGEGSNKSKRQNEIKPELFEKDKDIRRSRSPSQSFIEPIMEDVNAETEHEQDHPVRKISQTPIDLSNVPDITITDDPNKYDSDEEPFRTDYDATSIKSTPLKESHITHQSQVSETPAKIPSLSYAQETEFKMTEEEYQETLAKQYEVQEQAHQTYKLCDRGSPSGSDSFEMLDQPDLVDDFVVIEEIAKEANEFDTEGRSLQIQKTIIVKKHDEEVEKLIVKSAPADPNEGSILYAATHDELGFDFEDSPPMGAAEGGMDHEEYNKRWVEMQRAVLEDIKEEDTDFEVGSSRISSFKDSFSSTPEYDIHKKLKQREQDAISVNSLQEFESLEQAISLENRKYIQGSLDSLSNGSFPKKFIGRSVEGDGISLSSLREFEGLEDACLEAHLLEIRAKEEAALLLSRSDESNKSDDVSKVKVQRIVNTTTNKDGGSTTITTITKTTVGDMSEYMDKDFKTVTEKKLDRVSENEYSKSNVMEASTDSLEAGSKNPINKTSSSRRDSADSLEINKSSFDIMTSSVDSIELGREEARSSRSDVDSLELAHMPGSQSIDSIDLNQHITRQFDDTHNFTTGSGDTVVRTITTLTTTSVVNPATIVKDISSDSLNLADQDMRQMTNSESMEYTSSTATNATYKNATDSQMSSSVTSCDSTTMIDTLDHMVLSSGTNSKFNYIYSNI